MKAELLARRAEMLDYVAKGFKPFQFIPLLTEKYHRTGAALYTDLKKIDEWAPIVSTALEGVTLTHVILAGMQALIAQGWAALGKAKDNVNARIGAIRTLQSLYLNLTNLLIVMGKVEPASKEALEQVKDQFPVDWEKLSVEERTIITNGARLIIKSGSAERSPGLH